MFLRHRATQAEYFDSPDRTLDEVAEGYRLLNRVNRWLLFADPFQRILPNSLGHDHCRNLSILDVGAGDGALGSTLRSWAATKSWNWTITNLDTNPLALNLAARRQNDQAILDPTHHKAPPIPLDAEGCTVPAPLSPQWGDGSGVKSEATKDRHPAPRNVVASATRLPFQDASFDVVIAAQMAHHLNNDAQVIAHFREAHRVARRAVFLNDVHRNPAVYLLIWGILKIHRAPLHFFEDGLISVRRGWRISEWKRLAHEAGMDNARIWLYWGSRIMLLAKKAPPASPATKPFLTLVP